MAARVIFVPLFLAGVRSIVSRGCSLHCFSRVFVALFCEVLLTPTPGPPPSYHGQPRAPVPVRVLHKYVRTTCTAWRGVARRDVAWRGVAWRGVAWRGVAWRGIHHALAGTEMYRPCVTMRTRILARDRIPAPLSAAPSPPLARRG
jgi:hypothetical protein